MTFRVPLRLRRRRRRRALPRLPRPQDALPLRRLGSAARRRRRRRPGPAVHAVDVVHVHHAGDHLERVRGRPGEVVVRDDVHHSRHDRGPARAAAWIVFLLFLAAAAAAAAAFLEGLETPEDKALSPAERERREHGWRRRRHATPPRNRAGRGRKRLALVFGREVEGLFDDEVNQCDAVCSIPTGRLIESLSVSHAAVIILSQYYQARVGGGGGGVA
mmetsp:Transcript_4538/g.16101  ORF Transcript_4538/g.16101 Transcript_4538/m.16101 type:complete len:217 (-) Transcript_4538:92-742(-)